MKIILLNNKIKYQEFTIYIKNLYLGLLKYKYLHLIIITYFALII